MPIGIRVTEIEAASGALDADDTLFVLRDGLFRRATKAQLAVNAASVPLAISGAGSLIAFGDSIVAASGYGNGAAMFSAYSGAFRYLRNAGVGGNTSTMMLARIQADVIDYTPEWCWLQATPNDATLAGADAAAKAAVGIANFKEMISMLRAAGIKPIFCLGPPHDTTLNRDVVRYVNAHMGPWCQAEMIPLVDFNTPCADPADGTWATGHAVDAAHPGPVGIKAFVEYNSGRVPAEVRALGEGMVNAVNDPFDKFSGIGLFATDTNADGLANSWTVQMGTATYTRTQITDPALGVGYWQNIAPTTANRVQIYADGAALTTGREYEASFRFKSTDIGWAVRVATATDIPATMGDSIGVMPDTTDPAGIVVTIRFVATSTSARVFLCCKGNGGSFSVAQLGIRDLTAQAALAP